MSVVTIVPLTPTEWVQTPTLETTKRVHLETVWLGRLGRIGSFPLPGCQAPPPVAASLYPTSSSRSQTAGYPAGHRIGAVDINAIDINAVDPCHGCGWVGSSGPMGMIVPCSDAPTQHGRTTAAVARHGLRPRVFSDGLIGATKRKFVNSGPALRLPQLGPESWRCR